MAPVGTLIPHLPDDIALLCLIRLPRAHHSLLKSVCSSWRSLLHGPSFYASRRNLGFTDESLFLLPLFSKMPHKLECVELDLASQAKRKVKFRNLEVFDNIFLEGHACVSYGQFVMILGGLGFGEDPHPSAKLNIFDTFSNRWTIGAAMLSPRGEFAWGVIEGRLYVAGGHGGAAAGTRREAEVYDFGTNRWSSIASMPVCMMVDLFFVLKGRLFLRGFIYDTRVHHFFSYKPSSDEWREEKWMLRVFQKVRPMSTNKVVTVGKDETVYMIEIEETEGEAECDTDPVYLRILKLDVKTLEWKKVHKFFDEVTHYDCQCSDSMDRHPGFHGLKSKVLVMDHSEEAEDIEVTKLNEILRVSLLCPSSWATAIINC